MRRLEKAQNRKDVHILIPEKTTYQLHFLVKELDLSVTNVIKFAIDELYMAEIQFHNNLVEFYKRRGDIHEKL